MRILVFTSIVPLYIIMRAIHALANVVFYKKQGNVFIEEIFKLLSVWNVRSPGTKN